MEAAAAEARARNERNRLMLKASALGLLPDVQRLVETLGADATCEDKDRAQPAHFAAAGGHVDVLSFLLSHGVDSEVEDAAGRTPLHAAAITGKLAAVETLLSRGALVDASDGHDDTPLSLACRHGNADVARALLRAGASHRTRNKRGLTPLAEAVANNAPEAAELLLSAGADAAGAAAGRAGACALTHVAAGLGHEAALRLLLAKGSDCADARNAAGVTPLHVAVMANQPATAELLLRWGKEKGSARALLAAVSRSGQTAADYAAALPAGDADADRIRAALRAAGAKTAAQLGVGAATAAAAPPPSAAAAFAALPVAAQRQRLQRWAETDAAAAAEAAAAGLEGEEARHLAAARELRAAAELEDVCATMLEDDDWQSRMAAPRVRQAVADIQDDPANIEKWGQDPEAMEALGQLRRLQGFCKPRGLKVAITQLLRTADVTADAARARAARNRASAANALEAAREALLARAAGRPQADPRADPPQAPPASGATAVVPAPAAAATAEPAAAAATAAQPAAVVAAAAGEGAAVAMQQAPEWPGWQRVLRDAAVQSARRILFSLFPLLIMWAAGMLEVKKKAGEAAGGDVDAAGDAATLVDEL